MSIEAMKQALEALEEVQKYDKTSEWFEKKVSALRQAIAEAEKQEGWVLREVYFSEGEPVSHREPQWVGLTDEEIWEAERIATIRHQRHKYSIRGQQITPADNPQWHHARAIEAKLKEKNK
jgi:hypothetical protein